MELLVKFPVETKLQYSVVLAETKVASIDPPAEAQNASTFIVTAPIPVKGFTTAIGK